MRQRVAEAQLDVSLEHARLDGIDIDGIDFDEFGSFDALLCT
jgi:hypothetical protein